MPLPFRVKGVSISTATNWVFNYIVGEVTPVLQDVIRWRLYPMHAFFCVCSFILVYFTYPETCGVPLEEMSSLFADVGLEGDERARGADDEHERGLEQHGRCVWWRQRCRGGVRRELVRDDCGRARCDLDVRVGWLFGLSKSRSWSGCCARTLRLGR